METVVRCASIGRCWAIVAALACVAAMPWASLASQDCEPEWTPNLFLPPGVSSDVRDAVVWDDGRGPALYVAGEFFSAGGTSASMVARWDGQSWESLTSITGSQLTGDEVRALAVFDDGRGPALFAGGDFFRAGGLDASSLARWDGRAWRPVTGPIGEGVNGIVDCLVVHVDDDGPALYVGGQFDRAGGVSASNVARWDGSEWSRLGPGFAAGVDGRVLALESFDDGDGADLYVGGVFTSATGAAGVRSLGRWDGSAWSTVGSAPDSTVAALHATELDGSSVLVIGGSFQQIGGVGASLIAQFDGSDWRPIGDGLEGDEVRAILEFEDQQGRVLFAGGSLERPGSRGEDVGILGWDGSQWTSPEGGVQRSVTTLTEFDGRLFAGGRFEFTSRMARVNNVATWGPGGWRSLGSGLPPSTVFAMAPFDQGDGPVLYVGGSLESVDGQPALQIARWDGSSWLSPLPGFGGPFTPSVRALATFDDGSGEALYAGGRFTSVGNQQAVNNVARWDGRAWSVVGEGLDTDVLAFTVHDDGSGPSLFAGGEFRRSGNEKAQAVAQWTGDRWAPLGPTSAPGIVGVVEALASWGGDLYAGGRFRSAGGVDAVNIARWDGSAWSAVADGLDGQVHALAVFGPPGDESLYAAGEFTFSGTVRLDGVARWDGTQWLSVDGGLNGDANAMIVHDDGDGAALYVAGPFGQVGPPGSRIPAGGLAKWTGDRWEAVATFVDGEVFALADFASGSESALYAGGFFDGIDGVVSSQIARRSSCATVCPADFDGDGSLTLFDFLAFQSAFDLGEPAADFDGDGALTLFDFLAFQSAFAVGCP
ncbi:MAG: GC-type dockerin domain-anchored protein [Phycisphaerales bacterium]|jgi:hypothetical protein